MLTHHGILSSFDSQRLIEDGATADPSDGPRTVMFELESLVIRYFWSHRASSSDTMPLTPGMSLLGAGLGFRSYRRGPPYSLLGGACQVERFAA